MKDGKKFELKFKEPYIDPKIKAYLMLYDICMKRIIEAFKINLDKVGADHKTYLPRGTEK